MRDPDVLPAPTVRTSLQIQHRPLTNRQQKNATVVASFVPSHGCGFALLQYVSVFRWQLSPIVAFRIIGFYFVQALSLTGVFLRDP